MGQTVIEKIVQRHALALTEGQIVRSGDFVTLCPAHVMTHDNTSAVLQKFERLGARRVRSPHQPVFGLDHGVQDRSASNLAKYARIESFAREQGITFHPAGRGIVHQILCEEGFVLPGSLVVGSDSHSNIYGALGALGTPVVRTDAAALWATGETWWQVPPVARVTLTGRLRAGISGKDVILTLIGTFDADEVLNHAVEFTGEGVASLTIEQRLTIANMTTEWGALAGVMPFDSTTRAFLETRAAAQRDRGDDPPRLDVATLASLDEWAVDADPDAEYAVELTLALDSVGPVVTGPDHVKRMIPLGELEPQHVAIQKAYLLSCVNGRFEDIRDAAAVVKGRTVHPGVGFYMAAASSEIESRARESGDWQTLLDAGARPLPPGCGPCIGLGEGLLEDGQTGISATNRNFKGRMGSRDAQAYLASPAVVAASAIKGEICGPEALDGGASAPAPALQAQVVRKRETAAAGRSVALLESFPAIIEGELLFVDQDNLNTDGIYGKDVTYRDDLTAEEMGRQAFLNYDPAFQERAREGDLLVGGYTFGSGSSREQAATALAYRGIRLVIAASFSDTYKRNAFNNGFICIDCPALVGMLRTRFTERVATRRTGLRARIEFATATVCVDDERFAFHPLGKAAQELVIAGGLEALVRQRLAQGDDE